ncbi:MAG: ribosome-associated translation inhibitor RaiA [bacterium]
MRKIIFSGRNYKISSKDKIYITEKINKHSEFMQKSTNRSVIITENLNDHGTIRNFKVEIAVDMPNAFIKVESRGKEIYAIVDKLEVILKRRLKRYHDQSRKWLKSEPWKTIEFAEITKTEINEIDLPYNNYEPLIKRKIYENDPPLNPAEAIEHMELLGHRSFLFKNIENGKYAMIYKRDALGYGMIQPK